ncbi:hypothetical protein GCK72_013309 [Caenorhabditis remanei]|uniref:Uncharacterized protein n=1 Tax=Caenorhabditis remanei TaxID=31234 RepID=A0A6A5GQQ4_CAERE|nr:hypothetical protein GCK72_013309 [Caenorhabditis remanei]KAF1756855.1 hypothetical protein GCK72_013309 [Caenorhabditis remanei]
MNTRRLLRYSTSVHGSAFRVCTTEPHTYSALPYISLDSVGTVNRWAGTPTCLLSVVDWVSAPSDVDNVDRWVIKFQDEAILLIRPAYMHKDNDLTGLIGEKKKRARSHWGMKREGCVLDYAMQDVDKKVKNGTE